MKKLFLLCLPMVLVLGACSAGDDGANDVGEGAVDLVAAADEAAMRITESPLREAVAYLANDALEGRGPGGDGDRMARQYLIDRMTAMGLEPAGPSGSWEQEFGIVGITTTSPATWSFAKGGGSLTLEASTDFIAASGVQTETAGVSAAEVVFVGYGIQAPEHDWDDYAGVDVTGKVVLILNNDPDWDPELFGGERRLLYGRWTYKYQKAAERGAAGAIIMHTRPSAGYPWQVVQTSWTGEQFEIPAGDEPRLQVAAWTTEDATRRLAKLAGEDLDELVQAARSVDFEARSLGLTTSLELTNSIRGGVTTANVLGKIPGRDPELAKQVVVFSAHHDHLGVGTPNDDGDTIYNGALDNGAGCAQLLAMAEAFQALPQKPRRTVMFAFVGAEESGLLGSRYFADHPTVAPGLMAANLNFDGGNIWGRSKDVTYVGHGKSSLDAVVERFAGEQGRVVKPDQFPDRGYFYRSDQFHFARIGVPAVYLDTGTEFVDRPDGWGVEQIEAWESVHYHQPSDELVDAWNFDGMIEDAQLGFKVGVWVAEQDDMPTWNAGDEFEAVRLQALAAQAPAASSGD